MCFSQGNFRHRIISRRISDCRRCPRSTRLNEDRDCFRCRIIGDKVTAGISGVGQGYSPRAISICQCRQRLRPRYLGVDHRPARPGSRRRQNLSANDVLRRRCCLRRGSDLIWSAAVIVGLRPGPDFKIIRLISR